MNNVWKKYQEFWFIYGYIILLVGIFWFIIKPLFSEINEKKIEAEKKNIEREILSKKINDLTKLKEEAFLIEKNENKLSGVFFQNEKAVSLIEQIELLAEATGNEIELKIIESKNENKKTNSSEDKNKYDFQKNLFGENFLAIQLGLKGDFISIMKFIYRIENINYFSDIISFKLEANKNDYSRVNSAEIFQSIKKDSLENLNGEIAEKQDNEIIDNQNKNIINGTLEIVFYFENSK